MYVIYNTLYKDLVSDQVYHTLQEVEAARNKCINQAIWFNAKSVADSPIEFDSLDDYLAHLERTVETISSSMDKEKWVIKQLVTA